MAFRQSFEIEADCKKASTAVSRFVKKFPAVERDWSAAETFEYMIEHGLEKFSEAGWCFWCYIDEQRGTHYLAFVVTDEYYKVN